MPRLAAQYGKRPRIEPCSRAHSSYSTRPRQGPAARPEGKRGFVGFSPADSVPPLCTASQASLGSPARRHAAASSGTPVAESAATRSATAHSRTKCGIVTDRRECKRSHSHHRPVGSPEEVRDLIQAQMQNRCDAGLKRISRCSRRVALQDCLDLGWLPAHL